MFVPLDQLGEGELETSGQVEGWVREMFWFSPFSVDTHGTVTCSFRSFVKNRGEKKNFP